MFKTSRYIPKQRSAPRVVASSCLEHVSSSPEVQVRCLHVHDAGLFDGLSASETQLPTRDNDSEPSPTRLEQETARGDQSPFKPEAMEHLSASRDVRKCPKNRDNRNWTSQTKCGKNAKKSGTYSPISDGEDALSRQIRDIHNDTRKSARIIRDSRARLLEMQKKSSMTETDVKELSHRNELLLREMERFDSMTRNIQKLVAAELIQLKRAPEPRPTGPYEQVPQYVPGSVYEPPLHHEMRMGHPTVLLGPRTHPGPCETPFRSKSEIDLGRKLSESYDMQEKLAADNADLEVKRYILYKELMTKDQNLETCRAQIKRLQGELKLMNKENSLLHEKLDKNNPEGDAASVTQDITCSEAKDQKQNTNGSGDLIDKLENYKCSSQELEKQVRGLEQEVQKIREEMGNIPKTDDSPCKSGGANCFKQPPGPPVPPMTRACGVCPPCPAPCNPTAPPTPAEKEVTKLSIQLKQTEETFKTKITECALLRAELLKKKEELEKEKCQHREVQNRLRELEMKFEGLASHTNKMLGTKEEALEAEVSVKALKQCYREAREEIDELRTLMKEQNDQLQDYRVKYLSAQQTVEEQKRQMDMMDMDNSRISEQINLEIQKVKIKFQEKLQELTPIPDLLKATQMRLKDAQQSQAIAEHNAEQLARELNCAREKVHMLLYNQMKPAEKTAADQKNDDKQLQLLQQRITQLTENNMALKTEIERLKSNVIRMEESVLANEKRLQEKMHECAQLGGELDRARDEASRALQRAHDRTEMIRKCMQTTVAELERQLAASRAQVSSAEKEREELQCRMQCQIGRLNDNFEQAQLRILGLQSQVQSLRRNLNESPNYSDGDDQECVCKSFFEDAA